ncbi:hypothetical protein ACWV95_20145 [Streptomyces albus]
MGGCTPGTRGPRAFASSFVDDEPLYAMVPERLAREYGLIDDSTYPKVVATAWEHVDTLHDKIRENSVQREAADIRVERIYEELYDLLGGPQRAEVSAQSLHERYEGVTRRLGEQLVERAGLRDAYERLGADHAKAKWSAHKLTEWYQQDPATRTGRPPAEWKPNERDEELKAAQHPLAPVEGDVAAPSPHEAPPEVPVHRSREIRDLIAMADSPGGWWAGQQVPPQHLEVRERLKADALRGLIRNKRAELNAARNAGDADLVTVRGGELAYLQRALGDAVRTAENMRQALDEELARLDREVRSTGGEDDVRGQAEAETRRALAQEVRAHLSTGGLLDTSPGEVADLRMLRDTAWRGVSTAAGGAHGVATEEEHRDEVKRLENQLHRAKVKQAVLDFATDPQRFPQPSALPATRATRDLSDAEREALRWKEALDALVRFEPVREPGEDAVTRYTGPDGTVYDVFDPHSVRTPEATKGEGLPLSLDAGLAALDHAGLAQNPYEGVTSAQRAAQVRADLAHWVRTNPELVADWAEREPDDVFTPDDLAAAGLGVLDTSGKDAHQKEFDEEGVVHFNVPTTPEQRAELLARQLERPGGTEVKTGALDVPTAGYDNSAMDLAHRSCSPTGTTCRCTWSCPTRACSSSTPASPAR